MSRTTLLALAATAALGTAATGCAGRYTLLSVPAISMTNTTFDAGYHATPGPHVQAEFCHGDKPVVSQDDHCVIVEGTAMK
jgi:hypothetical protein